MTAIDTDDLVVVSSRSPEFGLDYGEVARVIGRSNTEVYVFGLESHQYGYLPIESLIPLSDIHADDYTRYEDIHDYVYEGDNE